MHVSFPKGRSIPLEKICEQKKAGFISVTVKTSLLNHNVMAVTKNYTSITFCLGKHNDFQVSKRFGLCSTDTHDFQQYLLIFT